MTQMSDHRRFQTSRLQANRASRHAGSPLARALHNSATAVYVVALVLLAGGCVIPPSLSSSRVDAGANSPPMIVEVKSQTALQEGSKVTFAVTNPDPVTIDLLDTDTSDTLYVRMFVDYNKVTATPPRVNCPPATTSKSPTRTIQCPILGLCESTDTGTLGLSIVVFDREPIDGVMPLYQAMPSDGL